MLEFSYQYGKKCITTFSFWKNFRCILLFGRIWWPTEWKPLIHSFNSFLLLDFIFQVSVFDIRRWIPQIIPSNLLFEKFTSLGNDLQYFSSFFKKFETLTEKAIFSLEHTFNCIVSPSQTPDHTYAIFFVYTGYCNSALGIHSC